MENKLLKEFIGNLYLSLSADSPSSLHLYSVC